MSKSAPALVGRGLAALALRGLGLGLLCGLCAMSVRAEGGERTPKPVIVIESQEHCIAPPEQMRREHPNMLRHQRERTVHLGERGMKVSLNGCIACHADRQSGSVIGSDHAFCQGCHSYAAVRIDCFDCHQSSVRRTEAGLTPGAIR